MTLQMLIPTGFGKVDGLEALAEIRRNEKKKKKSGTKINPSVKNFLGGDFGRRIHQEIENKYGTYGITKNIGCDESGVICGTNPFYVVAANEFLRKSKLRTVTQAELEAIRMGNKVLLEGHTFHTSLVWKNAGRPNEYLSQDFLNQFDKYTKLIPNQACVVPLWTLDLQEDSNAPINLSFKLTGQSFRNYFQSDILSSAPDGSYISDRDLDVSTGVPLHVYKFSAQGSRKLLNRYSGLSSLGLTKQGNLDAAYSRLSTSDKDGRLIVVDLNEQEGQSP